MLHFDKRFNGLLFYILFKSVGKHLKALHIEIDIPNTVVIDIIGHSEPVSIIEIY